MNLLRNRLVALVVIAVTGLAACRSASSGSGGGTGLDGISGSDGAVLGDAAGGTDAAGGDASAGDSGTVADILPPTDVVGPMPDAIDSDVQPPQDMPGPEDTPIPADVPPPQDSAADTTPKPTAPVGFRVTSFALVAPKACAPIPGSATCSDVTAAVNGLIQANLDDKDAPLDLVAVITPKLQGYDGADLQFGNADCSRDAGGKILFCKVQPLNTLTFTGLKWATTGSCSADPVVDAPCFETPPKSGAINVLGVALGLNGAVIEAQVAADSKAIPAGVVRGFMPAKSAASTGVQFGGTTITLAELFASTPTTTDAGLDGWWVTLTFTGANIPWIP